MLHATCPVCPSSSTNSGIRKVDAEKDISNTFYLVRSHSKSTEVSNQFIIDLLAGVEVAETGKLDALAALEFGMRDFEGALQIAAAVACGAEVILTRNTTDFKASPIPVMTPEEFLIQISH